MAKVDAFWSQSLLEDFVAYTVDHQYSKFLSAHIQILRYNEIPCIWTLLGFDQ